jgi:hypothetical protein
MEQVGRVVQTALKKAGIVYDFWREQEQRGLIVLNILKDDGYTATLIISKSR